MSAGPTFPDDLAVASFRDILRPARRQPGFVGLVVLILSVGIAGTTVAQGDGLS
jgi:hypothetical protein